MGEFSASFNAGYYGRLFAAHGPMPRTSDQFSLDFGDPLYDFASFQFAASLFAMDNTYGVDPECCTVERQPGSLSVRAAGLRCAGGQQRAQGSVLLQVSGEHRQLPGFLPTLSIVADSLDKYSRECERVIDLAAGI